jgi:hypothetical protein
MVVILAVVVVNVDNHTTVDDSDKMREKLRGWR